MSSSSLISAVIAGSSAAAGAFPMSISRGLGGTTSFREEMLRNVSEALLADSAEAPAPELAEKPQMPSLPEADALPGTSSKRPRNSLRSSNAQKNAARHQAAIKDDTAVPVATAVVVKKPLPWKLQAAPSRLPSVLPALGDAVEADAAPASEADPAPATGAQKPDLAPAVEMPQVSKGRPISARRAREIDAPAKDAAVNKVAAAVAIQELVLPQKPQLADLAPSEFKPTTRPAVELSAPDSSPSATPVPHSVPRAAVLAFAARLRVDAPEAAQNTSSPAPPETDATPVRPTTQHPNHKEVAARESIDGVVKSPPSAQMAAASDVEGHAANHSPAVASAHHGQTGEQARPRDPEAAPHQEPPTKAAEPHVDATVKAVSVQPTASTHFSSSKSNAAPDFHEPIPAATRIETPAPPAAASRAPVNDIRLRIPDEVGRTTEVRFVENRGEVRVSVRTSDNHLAGELRSELHQLTDQLSQNGIQAEVWAGSSRSSGQENEPQQYPSRQGSGDGSSPSHQQRDSSEQQQRDSSRWQSEYESMFPSQVGL